jgi:hypothetical protein
MSATPQRRTTKHNGDSGGDQVQNLVTPSGHFAGHRHHLFDTFYCDPVTSDQGGGDTLPTKVRLTRAFAEDSSMIAVAAPLSSPPSGPKPHRPPRTASSESPVSTSPSTDRVRTSRGSDTHGSAAPKKPSSSDRHLAEASLNSSLPMFGGAAKRDRRLMGSPALVNDLESMTLSAASVKKRLDFEEPGKVRVNHFDVLRNHHPRSGARPSLAESRLFQAPSIAMVPAAACDVDDEVVDVAFIEQQKRHRSEFNRRR